MKKVKDYTIQDGSGKIEEHFDNDKGSADNFFNSLTVKERESVQYFKKVWIIDRHGAAQEEDVIIYRNYSSKSI